MDVYDFIVTEEAEGERLDQYVSDCIDTISRSYLQKLIKEEKVTVNDKTITKSSYRLNCDDKISLIVPPAAALEIEAEEIPLDILYEDDDILVVNKPKGMVVHPAVGHYSGTLVNAIMFHCKDRLSGINGILRPGIVHRIDKDTSGSLIICKNDVAHNIIAAQLKEHSLKRIYKAIVMGQLKEDTGTIHAPIGRHHVDRKKMAVHPGGKDAITHYKVLERFKGYTYAEFRLETGRTHQIRVHMAHTGHPLLGDTVYGGGNFQVATNGQVLHAETISFIHPKTNELIEINAPMPEYFNKILEILRKKS